ncbi:hypothetical protein [Nostoc sp.]|uniref:hypothetical protein n=1 Tax=Nostoc sp. TaxID=1180 RepID=UPI0035943FEE
MEITKNGKQRSPQQEGSNQISNLKGEPGSLGVIPAFGRGHGDNQIGTSRKDSHQPDAAFGEWTDSGIPGKIISQLIDENERQLAYHEEQFYYHQQQIKQVQDRIQSLKQIPETLEDIVHTE